MATKKPSTDKMLKPHYLRMTDADWATFKAIGGADWLRARISAMKPSAVANRKRDVQIRKDFAEGLTDMAIAKKHNVDRVTVWRLR
jgi:hypothetical protein